MTTPRTRLAPSPTGALHLGNARTFLVNWALARQKDWEVVLRIEDLDGPRIKPGSIEETIDVLKWLGFDWDEGPFFQLKDLSPYDMALDTLARQGEIYPCKCTRSEIEAASLSAPHTSDKELRYPGTCRPAEPTPQNPDLLEEQGTSWRLRVPPGPIPFTDAFSGEQNFDVDQTVGDFLVRTKTKLASYQLAVVVDDARQGINQVVRGDDLLASTPRQILLYERLELGPVPNYTHVPMVIGEDGRRLAKRHGDSRLVHYRDEGVSPDRVIGLLAEWCGMGDRREMSIGEFRDEFKIKKMPKEPIVFHAEDDDWLLEK